MTKILCLNDLHITCGQDIVGLNPADRTRRVLNAALRDHPDAAHLIVSGDLTHNGTTSEYHALRDLLAKAGLPEAMPVTLLLGNHDNRSAYLEVFPDAPLSPGGFVQTAIDAGDWRLICLDTLDGPPPPPDIHSGILCPARLDWLANVLADGGEQPTVLFTHHPPYDTGFDGMDAIGLKRSEDLWSLLAPYPNVRLIVSGHIHRTLFGAQHGRSVAMFKSPCHQMPLTLGEGGFLDSVDEPGAYGLLVLGEGDVVIHSEDVPT